MKKALTIIAIVLITIITWYFINNSINNNLIVEKDTKNVTIEKSEKASILLQYIITDWKTKDIKWYGEYILWFNTKKERDDKMNNEEYLKTEAAIHNNTYGKYVWDINLYSAIPYDYDLSTSNDLYDKEMLKVLDFKYNKQNLCFLTQDGFLLKDDDSSKCNPLNEEDWLKWYFATNKSFCYSPVECSNEPEDLKKILLNDRKSEIVKELKCNEDMSTQCQLIMSCSAKDYTKSKDPVWDEYNCIETEYNAIKNK